MSLTLLQIDFPFDGPWGEDMAAAMEGLARDIAATPGLKWKIWTENREAARAGGIYLFEDADSASRYCAVHVARLQGFGVKDIRALDFQVNEALCRIDRAPL
ncbi:MAG: monooxygenase [Betaproteobacteria bacterium]|nr:MAG: monooxygenase [Betaproteobacteria bacterium]